MGLLENTKNVVYSNQERYLNLILHGSSKGFKTSESIQKTFQTDKDLGRSVVMFNFPFMDRNEIRKEGGGLDEEIATLKEVLQKCNATQCKKSD